MTQPQSTLEKQLTGQVAVVTGAARGIGEAVSRRAASLGAHVLLIARDSARLAAVQEGIESSGGRATVYPLDLRNPSAIEEFSRTLAGQWERCDVLVNNAGVGRFN